MNPPAHILPANSLTCTRSNLQGFIQGRQKLPVNAARYGNLKITYIKNGCDIASIGRWFAITEQRQYRGCNINSTFIETDLNRES